MNCLAAGVPVPSKPWLFVELIDTLDEGIRVAQVGHVIVPFFSNWMKRRDEGLDVGGADGGVDEGAFEAPVNGVVGGVAVGIRPDPAVVVDGDVEGLRAVGDIVAEPSGVEEDGGFDGFGVLMLGGELAVVAHGGLETLPDFTGDVGLETHALGAEVGSAVGMRGNVRIERGDVLVALAGQRSDEVGVFEVDEVVGGLGSDQLGLGAGTPAIGLRAEVGDLGDGFRRAEEGGDVGRQGFGGEAVDHGVAFAAPAEGGGDGEQDRAAERRAGAGISCWHEYKGQRETSKKRANGQ